MEFGKIALSSKYENKVIWRQKMRLGEIQEARPVCAILFSADGRLEYSSLSRAQRMAEIFRSLGHKLTLVML